MRHLLVTAMVAGHLITPSVEAKSKPIHLATLTPWNVDYGEKICTLRRAFGTSENPSVVIMDRFGPTDSFQLTIVSDAF